MNLIEYATEQVMTGKTVRVDLIKKNLTGDKAYVVENGVVVGKFRESVEVDEVQWDDKAIKMSLYFLWSRYNDYRGSYPGKDTTDSKYFKALSLDELTDKQLLGGEQRNIAKVRLETYALTIAMQHMPWRDDIMGGSFFWQSEDKNLVVLKSWLT